MIRILSVIFLALVANTALAQQALHADEPPLIQPGDMADLDTFVWINRPLIILADSPSDPRFIQQMAYITDGLDELAARDVVVLTDTNPAAMGPLRQKLRPRGFMLVLIGKNGTIYLRKPFPWRVREITRSIDKLPLRQQELRDILRGN